MENETLPDRSHTSKHRKHLHRHGKHHKHETKDGLSKRSTRDSSPNHKNRHSSTRTQKKDPSDGQTSKGEHFVSDRKGDPGILQYGSNHSYEIPRYRRVGYGLVLGLSRSLKIDRDSDKEIRLVSSVQFGGKRNKAIFAKVAQSEEDTVWSSQTDSVVELDKDYLTLENRRRSDSHSSSENSEDDDSLDYKSATKKAKVPSALIELQMSTSRGEIPDHRADEIKWSRRVELDPSDAQAWLELIKRQTPRAFVRQTRAERLSSADIRVSMYEKALKHVTGSIREDLLRGLLREASFVWDEAKIRKKWEDTLRDNKWSFGLWKDYLDYHQTKSVRFRFDDLRTTFKEALRILQAVDKGSSTGIKDLKHEYASERTGLYALYLLLRYTICLRQAGYIEQAIAIWQMTLESRFCSTSSAKSEEAIESFWESEILRIGEPNARGLGYYNGNGGDVPPEQEDLPITDVLDIKAWLNHESNVTRLLPARTLDTTNEEDVFRVVLFPDIQPFLLSKLEPSSESVVDAFLLFNGLPPMWQAGTEDWANDPFIYGGSPMIKSIEDLSQLDTDQQSGSSCRISTDILFAGSKSPFDCFKRNTELPDRVDSRTLNLEFVRAILRHLDGLNTDSSHLRYTEYYLAFELRYYPQDVRKISKSCLKKHPRALILYNAHALIEYRLGNSDSATKILETAMKMCSEDSEVIFLKRTLVWESLVSGQPSLALKYLLEGSEIHDEATIFATQQSLLSGLDIAASHSPKLVISYMDCLLLLGYLTNPDPLPTAFAIFQSNLSFLTLRLKNRIDILEMSHQSLARLLYYHMQNHHYKTSLIRKMIQQSITAFPANTIFLSIFQLNEQRFRINDRVRSVVRDILSNQDISRPSPVVSHMFAIHSEMSRNTNLGSSAESIRSAFERAIEDDATRHCPAVWYLYTEFESSQSNKKKLTPRLQNVIFRAITACPWIRDFYLMAIRYSDEAQDGAEIKGAYEMMTERDLRIRCSLGL